MTAAWDTGVAVSGVEATGGGASAGWAAGAEIGVVTAVAAAGMSYFCTCSK